MVALVAGWLQARGLDYELQDVLPGRQNVVATLEGRGGPSVLFEAHMDTVETNGMEIAPFDPVVRGGKLYGRGSCDCKASMAAMLVALEHTAQRGTPPGDVTFAATIDEEHRFAGAKYMMEHGFRADGAVVGEPTSLDLIIAHKGVLRVRIATRGLAAHSSDPSQGESAIVHMTRVLEAIEAYGKTLEPLPQHWLVGRPTVSVGLISGGSAVNIVPDCCEIAVDRRVTPLETVDEVEAQLRHWLTVNLPGVPWEMSLLLADEALEGAPDSAIASRCEAALDAVMGHHHTAGVQYGTDASKFAAKGIPAVVLGPGSILQAHTAVEWVEIEQVEMAAKVYGEIMWGS
jgi:acetylornithine deacetylase